jgi:hypothetical protein
MRGSSNGSDGLDLFYMNVKGLKKGEKVYIEQTKPLGDKKYIKLDEKITNVGGKLTDIRFKDKEFEGDAYIETSLWLKDLTAGEKGEMYVLSFNNNSIGRSILNALLSIEGKINNLTLRFYNKKDTGYANVYIEHDGVKVGWKYNMDDVRPFIEESTVKKNGKTSIIKDYSALDNKLFAEIKAEVLPKLGKSPTTQTAPAATKNHSEIEDAQVVEESDDLPF